MRIFLVLCCAFLVGCADMSSGIQLSALGGSVSVADYGASGDGITDERALVQAALSSGATDVYAPAGTYMLGRGAGFWNLNIPGGVRLHGESQAATVFAQMPGMAGSVRLLQIGASDVIVEDLTLDGNKSGQTVDEHRAGTFVRAPTDAQGVMLAVVARVVIRRVTARYFTGDGFYGSIAGDPADPSNTGIAYEDVAAEDNDRNGLTWGGLIYSSTLVDSSFARNRAEQVDSETGPTGSLNNITVEHNTIDGSASNDYALTISGGSSASHSHNWMVRTNHIIGGINVVWANDIAISGNIVDNATTKPAITLWRDNADVKIADNTLTNTNTSTVSNAVIYVGGTGPGSTSSGVEIDHNTLTATGAAKQFGVRAEGAKDVTITRNTIVGPGLAAPGYSGIALRATIAADDFVSASARDNTIRNWGGYGLSVAGNGAARLLLLEISRNTFDDDGKPATMLTALAPDVDRLHAVKDLRIVASTLAGGCTRELAAAPVGTSSPWGTRWVVTP